MSEPEDAAGEARRAQAADGLPDDDFDETNFVTRRRESGSLPDPDPDPTVPRFGYPDAASASDQPTQTSDAPLPAPGRLLPPSRPVERSQVAEQFVDHQPTGAGAAARPAAQVSPASAPPVEQTALHAAPPPVPPTEQPAPATSSTPPPLPRSVPTGSQVSHDQPPPAAAEPLPPATGALAPAAVPEIDLSPASTGGLGELPQEPIVSLPPITPEVAGYPLSPRTGEPARRPLIVAASVSFGLSALVAMGTYWWYWWQAINITNFGSSAKLIELFDPRPGSGSSVVLVCVMAVIGIIMTAGPGVAGYNTWHGASWAKGAGVVACVTSLLAFFVIGWSWLALLFAAIGTVLIWLPQARPYFAAWHELNGGARPVITPPTKVAYGPAPRYR